MKLMKRMIAIAVVTTAFLAFTSSTVFAEETSCEVLEDGICTLCGDDSDACGWIKQSVLKTTESECDEVITMLLEVLEEVESMDEEAQAIFVDEFCKVLGEE